MDDGNISKKTPKILDLVVHDAGETGIPLPELLKMTLPEGSKFIGIYANEEEAKKAMEEMDKAGEKGEGKE